MAMKDEEFEKFIGKKLADITLTYSFRLSVSDTQKLLEYQPLVIEIKGIKFKMERVK
jgi:hypothetical protein